MADYAINKISTSQKTVAITFDNGPNPIYTPQVLEIFSKAGGKATFFMIGQQVIQNPEIVKEVAKQGHEIGNHTYTHANLQQLSPGECQGEIERNEIVIQELTGQKPVVFRPPYLEYNNEMSRFLQEKGYSMIGALNLEARDWEQPGIEHILAKSRNCVSNGSILIFHDGFGDRSQTIEAVRRLVSEITSQGYQLMSISELLEHTDK